MDKINIYVPEDIGHKLDNDAELFEIFKNDGHTINRNKFLSMLLLGYYNKYMVENQERFKKIYDELSNIEIDDYNKQIITNNILQNVLMPVVPTRKGKNPMRLSLKPTQETENLILSIYDDMGGEDFISQYFCKMFMSYCTKPFSEREQIIFKTSYDVLLEACDEVKTVSFTTKWNKEKIHQVIPYKIAVGVEEMFNYLVCAEENEETGLLETKSYRLNRITKINYSYRNSIIPENVIINMNRMLEYGPQYAINSDEEICVKLNENGKKTYNRVYYGRPKFDRLSFLDNNYYLYFSCSEDQVFLYFRRFGGGMAEIIAPISLRKRMVNSYINNLKTYEEK